MTPEQIELIVRNAIAAEAHRYDLLALLLVVGGSFAAAFLGSYLHAKANHKAIKEDLDILTAQASATTKATEGIKAQIGTSSWVQQQRWEVKRQLYTDLLSALFKLADAYRDIIDLELSIEQFASPMHTATRLVQEKRREKRAALIAPLWEEVLRVRGFGELTLVPGSIDVLNQLRKIWAGDDDPNKNVMDDLEERYKALSDAHQKIVLFAKVDLDL